MHAQQVCFTCVPNAQKLFCADCNAVIHKKIMGHIRRQYIPVAQTSLNAVAEADETADMEVCVHGRADGVDSLPANSCNLCGGGGLFEGQVDSHAIPIPMSLQIRANRADAFDRASHSSLCGMFFRFRPLRTSYVGSC
jgi:hypothetical protein